METVSSQFLVPSPDDFDGQRADRSLGMRRAARYYNELVAPGIGGAWKVRHLSWAVAGLYLRSLLGDKHSAVALAHGVEALGSKQEWSLLPEAQQAARTGLRGTRAFNRTRGAWSFKELSQRRCYVQVTHRQQVTRALPLDTGLGLAEGSSRFNGMVLSTPGIDLAEALLNQQSVGRGRPRLLQTLKEWVLEDFEMTPGVERLAQGLGPSSPSEDERKLVLGRLLSQVSPGSVVGPRDPRRRIRLIEFLEAEVGDNAGWSDVNGLRGWLEAQPGGAAHANDLRTALAFEDMRAAAVAVLDAVGVLLLGRGSRLQVEACAKHPAVQSALARFRVQAAQYRQSAAQGDNGHADARGFFAQTDAAPDDAALVAALVRREGRILELGNDTVYRGPLFHVFQQRADGVAGRAIPDLEEAEESAPTGRPARLFSFIALWRDCNAQA